ncbi:MAG: hypothetical protein GY832_24970 [Chloroflexi bacterium]|nr:hypothetical protein [Chloroflexota bacterium]
MNQVRKCRRCGVVTRFSRCTCGSSTISIPDCILDTKLSAQVTLGLRIGEGNEMVLLVQKASGEERVPLASCDLLHT